MRLTLRTLLAYMDGLLDAKDTQEIAKKIEDSQFATDLFHKIRDVMRRLRLAAPSLTERAANLDCNTVAEYLDNELPPDRLPDFEEVCLKSEMHLAEVAACHQILTMVLGEPVDIDIESRERMYQLPTISNRVDEERLAAAEAVNMLSGDGNIPVPAAPVKIRPRPVVPEYLRDPPRKWRLLPAMAITFFAAAAITLILVMLGLFNPGTPGGRAWQWVQAKVSGKPADNAEPEDRFVKKSPNGLSVETSAKPSGSSAIVAPAPKDSGDLLWPAGKNDLAGTASQTLKEHSANPNQVTPPVTSAGLVVAGTGASTTVVSTTGAATTGGTSQVASVARGRGGAENQQPPASGHPGTEISPLKPLPAGPPAGSGPGKPPVEVARADAVPAMKPAVPPMAAGPAAPPQDTSKIGHFMSEGQDVLLKATVPTGWRRVLPDEFLGGNQPLLALPSYRPRLVVLNVGALLELVNGTRIELLPDNAQGRSGIYIDFGRVVIKPFAQAGVRLPVVVGSQKGTITLTSVESIAGLEVTRVHDPGTDPEKVFSHALTKLYVARGSAVWEQGDKPPARLTAPATILLDGESSDMASTPAKDVPLWLTANTVNELDQRAAVSVSQGLPADRDAERGLMELAIARQREIRWLAARCLGYVGQFDSLTAALNDPEYRREWPDYFDQLEEAIARGPETAGAIRQSLGKLYGNDAAALYRMLWGYTDKDLEDGEDARLVKFLEHEVPVFRVLAFENLRRITRKSLYYHPEATAVKRASSMLQWRQLLKAGGIRFKTAEEKPRSAPGGASPKGPVPPPPTPQDEPPPSDVEPTGATEPIVPRADAGAATRRPVSFPEPGPVPRRAPVAVPEP